MPQAGTRFSSSVFNEILRVEIRRKRSTDTALEVRRAGEKCMVRQNILISNFLTETMVRAAEAFSREISSIINGKGRE